MERRLVGILYADVVGYSRLMGGDEAGTLSRLKAHRKDFIDPTIAAHQGRIVKIMGDGALVEFPSVVNAVECAVEFQRGMVERNADVPQHQRIVFRIGVNLGDVIIEGDDIYGDGVNVAARLESLAELGGICIPGRVFQLVEGNVDVGYAYLGEQRVKNIEKPVNAYKVLLDPEDAGKTVGVPKAKASPRRWPAVAAGLVVVLVAAGASVWTLFLRQPADAIVYDEAEVLAMPTGPPIGVLPFDNLSGDSAQEFFSDGITEEIIAAFTRFRDLRVLARNTTFQYKGQAVDARQLARELNVDYLLEGSVRGSVDTIRVTAQLIDGASGAHLWADTYEADLTPANIFQVQSEITDRVVSAIGSSVGGAIAARRLRDARGRPPQLLSSCECVLTAAEWTRSLSRTTASRAYSCLKKAVEADPSYASAWAMLAYMYTADYLYEYGLEEDDSHDPQQLALETARRAVEIEPDSSLAYYALARAYLMNSELENFYAAAERALSLNPNDNFSLGTLGSLIAFTGRWDQGFALTEKAIALNPTAHPKWWRWPWAKDHFRKGEYEEALAGFQRTFIPGAWLSQLQLAYTYGQLARIIHDGRMI